MSAAFENGADVIPIRLPSGAKAVVSLPRPFTAEDAKHLMKFLTGYIEVTTAEKETKE